MEKLETQDGARLEQIDKPSGNFHKLHFFDYV